MSNSEIWNSFKQAILEKLTWQDVYGGIKKQKHGNEGWMVGLCPLHADHNPSFVFNTKTLRWCCFGGCGKGSVFDFIMATSGQSFKDTLLELADRLGIPKPEIRKKVNKPPISEDLVKQWQSNLWRNEEVLRWLREKRGLSDSTLRRYQIGWDPRRQRNSIPIRDERGNLVNVRFYNAKKGPKIINYTEGKHKYGSPARLYGLDELVKYQGKQVIVCEGEWDRLLLRQEGLMAVTGTHGCTVFRPEWISCFKDKDVVVIYDCDKEGRAAVQRIVLKALKNSGAASIKDITLPLRGTKDDKDITDYLHKRGYTGTDLQRLIDETPVHKYEEEIEQEEVIRLSSFTEIEREDLIDKKVQCEITVCGETSEAFHAVEQFRVTYCPKLAKGECFNCVDATTIPRGAREYVGSCMSTDVQLKAMLREYCCSYGQKPALEILKRTTVTEFFCHQKVNRITQAQDEEGNLIQTIDGKQQELLEKRVYYLSHERPSPGSYLATGWVKPHPKTQQVTFLIESMIPQQDDFEAFQIEKNLDHLRAFQALTWKEILADLSENVTRVYERDELLLATLLTYCSPRWIPFNGEIIRGWLVTVIMGDSGSGKTQTYNRIAEYANIGDIFSGLTGSRTGLAYALVEHKQKGWQLKIGRYPANSRRILIVDEAQHLRPWELRTISKAMEEGFLQIDRVRSGGYESQTRLIMVANPKEGGNHHKDGGGQDQIMDGFSFGCEALKTIYPPTVIRRIDLAVFANVGDLKDLSFIQRRGSRRPARITPAMLRAVIYWAWSLQPDQIVFTPEAEVSCLDKSAIMTQDYGFATDIPLVTLADFRKNLARISAAFAALLVSTNDDFSRLLIQPEHVEMSARLIELIYSHDNCGLNDYSEIKKQESQLFDYEIIRDAFLKKAAHEVHAGEESVGTFARAVYLLRISDRIRRDDLADQVGCSINTIKRIIQILKRYNLIDSTKNGYIKTPKFNRFLRRFIRDYPEFMSQNLVASPDSG